VNPEANLEVVDIVDVAALDRALDAASPAAIYQPRAQSSVTLSVADPQRDCEVNVRGTLNLLEAAARLALAAHVRVDRRRSVRQRGADPDGRGLDPLTVGPVWSVQMGG